jgi:hypothetical protein
MLCAYDLIESAFPQDDECTHRGVQARGELPARLIPNPVGDRMAPRLQIAEDYTQIVMASDT